MVYFGKPCPGPCPKPLHFPDWTFLFVPFRTGNGSIPSDPPGPSVPSMQIHFHPAPSPRFYAGLPTVLIPGMRT